MEIGIVTAFLGGLISFLSPCVLPLAPPYLAYLGGTTLDQIAPEREDRDSAEDRALRRRVFLCAHAKEHEDGAETEDEGTGAEKDATAE
ncbi:MAG: cytochrome c biogenesis protein CcdA, partial [Pseudomonadota bacterium]